MKHLISSFLALSITTSLLAQHHANLEQIFNAETCGCTIDVAQLDGADAENYIKTQVNPKFNLENLKNTFVINGKRNDVAIGIVEALATSGDCAKLQTAIGQMATQLSVKPKTDTSFIPTLKADLLQLATKNTVCPTRGRLAACLFARRLHDYYLHNPQDCLIPEHQNQYKTIANPNTATTEPIENQESPTSNNSTNIASSSMSDILLWVSLAANALLLFLVFKYRGQAQSADSQANKRIQELKDAHVIKEHELQQLQQQAATWASAEQQYRNEIKTKDATIAAYVSKLERQTVTNPLDNKQQPIANPTSQYLVKYLYAPSENGIFYSNAVKEQRDKDTFYELRMKADSEATALFNLVLDVEMLKRADAMAQQLLLPACELQGKGKLPADPALIQITPGTLRKEGAGWRVDKKIVLHW